jgi:hypothetical protein
MAPATNPDTPAMRMLLCVPRGGGDANDEAGCREDAIAGAKHRRPQPTSAGDEMSLCTKLHTWQRYLLTGK